MHTHRSRAPLRRARGTVPLAVPVLLVLVAGACSARAPLAPNASSPDAVPGVRGVAGAPSPPASVVGASPDASPSLVEMFPRASFSDPTDVDNPWLPLLPGTRWIWEGQTVDEDQTLPHRVVFVVTDMVKTIDGVETVVGYDRDYSDGELVEAELIFFAQDDEGNVWHLGQYPEEYDGETFVDAPGWIAGEEEAAAGLMMAADPAVGDRPYSQGWGPAVDWTDHARVVDEGVSDCVPVGCYDDVLVIEEWALDEPEAKQLKYYAPGVGNTRVGWAGSEDQEQETLELVEFGRLGADELTDARLAALGLEMRAYEILPDVYGETELMMPRP
jgi:hypothetical protein